MAIDQEKIKTLREMTSAGILDCEKILEETNGDLEKAASLLRERGIVKAVKRWTAKRLKARLCHTCTTTAKSACSCG
jgi:elongation factor Ts